jgi:hypothetical protein
MVNNQLCGAQIFSVITSVALGFTSADLQKAEISMQGFQKAFFIPF